MPRGAQIPDLERQVRNMIVRVEGLERKRPEVTRPEPPAEDTGGGSAILHGAGPPDAELGDHGDYYLDTTNYVLYGPKSTEAGGSGQHIDIADIGFEAVDVAGAFGPRIVFEQAGTITSATYRRDVLSTPELTLSVWRHSDLSLVAYVIDTRTTTGEYTVMWDPPVEVTAGESLVFSITGSPRCPVFTGYPSVTNTADCTFHSWRGSSGGYPGILVSGGCYIEPTFSTGTVGYWPVAVFGIPTGGTTGQVLTKTSGSDWDVEWA